MDSHIKDYYSAFSQKTSRGNFHKVIALHENLTAEWLQIYEKVPKIVRGWYELAHLPSKDRLEFLRDFWMVSIPYSPRFHQFLGRFFDSLDDIGVFVYQRKYDNSFEADLVYSIKNNSGFFRGGLPASEEEIVRIKSFFGDYLLPEDYLSFIKIHGSFCKTTDCTGLIRVSNMEETYKNFQLFLTQQEGVNTTKGKPVNPKTLIPFYESFGMPFFQCFWGEWYPQNEMGNVYYSGSNKTISDVQNLDDPTLEMAFPTFTDWLIFYLEQIS